MRELLADIRHKRDLGNWGSLRGNLGSLRQGDGFMNVSEQQDYYRAYAASRQAMFERFYRDFPVSPKPPPRKPVDRFSFFSNLGSVIKNDLDAMRSNPTDLNIWEGIGLERSELKHCSSLRWLLDPFANHAQGPLFLQCLVETVEELRDISPWIKQRDFEVLTEEAYTEGRVDIFVKSREFLLLIEVKVDADEQEEQLKRYQTILEHQGRIRKIPRELQKLAFLTLDRHEAKTGDAIAISWADVARAADAFAGKCPNAFVAEVVRQYAQFIHALS